MANQPRQRLRMGAISTRPQDTIKLVEEAIAQTKQRYLMVGGNTPWQIFHGVLALRHDFSVRQGNHLVRGLDWLRNGVTHNGRPLVEKTEHGARLHPYTEPWAFEGHTNQFLAILSLAGLPEEYQFRTARGEIVSMDDMINHAKLTMDGTGEMTWTLWFLSHYLDQDDEWETAAGQYWSMERLVRMEARHKVNGAPCGGTHRLFALSLARNAYLAKHGHSRGAWLEADQKVREHVAMAQSLQNRDGSLSADWFKGRKYSTDLTTRLKTSGHQLEWLMVALPDNQLDDRWVQMAVQSVANDVIRSATEVSECGALYHALDSLTFYKIRKNGLAEGERSPTYLVPPAQPETPSTPPTQMADAGAKPQQPKAEASGGPAKLDIPTVEIDPAPIATAPAPAPGPAEDPDAPAMFVAPETVQPIDANQKPEKVAEGASTERAVSALKSGADKPQEERPLEPRMAKETLVVEEVELDDIPELVADTTDSKPMQKQAMGKAGLPVNAAEVEAALSGKPIPENVAPLNAFLPEKPDSESAPNVVDSELPGELDDSVAEPPAAMQTGAKPTETESSDDAPEVAETDEELGPLEAPELPSEMKPVPQETSPAEKVAEEPQGQKRVSSKPRVQRSGLVVIDLDELERRPISVPIANEAKLRRVSTLPW